MNCRNKQYYINQFLYEGSNSNFLKIFSTFECKRITQNFIFIFNFLNIIHVLEKSISPQICPYVAHIYTHFYPENLVLPSFIFFKKQNNI